MTLELEVDLHSKVLLGLKVLFLFHLIVIAMRNWRIQRGGFARSSHSQRQFPGISARARLVLDGGEQFHAGRDGAIAPVHHRVLAVATGWISTTEPAFPDHGCTNVR